MQHESGEHVAGLQQALIPGLIGLSVYTDAVYLRAMHEHIAQTTAGAHGVSRLKYLLRTLDFGQLVEHARTGRWDLGEEQIAEAATSLQAGGAQFIVICANTGYALTSVARTRVSIPILDIARPVCTAIRAAGFRSPGLLSTLKTEKSGIYQAEVKMEGLTLVSPSPPVAQAVQDLIIGELVRGQITDNGMRVMEDAASWFAENGADCLILGCTDLTHLVTPKARWSRLPLFDSTRLHAIATADAAMGSSAYARCRG